MRVAPPSELRLDRETLLRAVRERLSQLDPLRAARIGDPTDPAWLLVEEAAWMVETLSARLDAYPAALMQQVVSMLGVDIYPALPAIALLVTRPRTAGKLCWSQTDPTRFLAPQTESRPPVYFVPAEREVSLVPARVHSWHSLRDGLLEEGVLAPLPTADRSCVRRPATWQRVGYFERPILRFRVPAGAEAAVVGAAKVLVEERGIGWLDFQFSEGSGSPVLSVTIDPNHAAPQATPYPGGSRLPWGRLPSTEWRPEVRFSNDPALPSAIRGTFPTFDADATSLVVPDVPPGRVPPQPLVLERPAPPTNDLVSDIWRSLNLVDALVPSQVPDDWELVLQSDVAATAPDWLNGFLQGGVWRQLARMDQSFVEVRLDQPLLEAAALRVVLSWAEEHARPGRDGGSVAEEVAFYAVLEGQAPSELPRHVTQPWRVPFSSGEGAIALETAWAWDVKLPAKATGLLVLLPGAHGASAVMLNAVLALNMPRVEDGREILVRSQRPEPVDLLSEDLVTRETFEVLTTFRLLDMTVPDLTPRVGDPYAGPPLAQYTVVRAGVPNRTVLDWGGVAVDATAGEVVLKPLRLSGPADLLQIGDRVVLDWYRRTDGAAGRLPAQTIAQVEQSVHAVPAILGVHNPYPTRAGRSREAPEATVDRVFRPQDTPVLPSEMERHLASHLGRLGAGWEVRVWTHAERHLFDVRLWTDLPRRKHSDTPSRAGVGGPFPAIAGAAALLDRPDATLVISLGPRSGGLLTADFEEVQREAESWFEWLQRRYANLSEVRIVPARGVTLWVPKGVQGGGLGFGLWDAPDGAFVVDAYGEARDIVPDVSLLDAFVVSVRVADDA
ncbi:MAG: hypothetical protein Q8P41_09975 [Pseudomonadota bacterium]|nr:hypothetical protein [Pseudomonadota bacterium]